MSETELEAMRAICKEQQEEIDRLRDLLGAEMLPSPTPPPKLFIDPQERLSKDFLLWEFLRSQEASRVGLDNTPAKEEVARLRTLAIHALQPIRDHFGYPVNINSGFRSLEVDCAIKITGINRRRAQKRKPPLGLEELVAERRQFPESWSQHVKGEAADIEILRGKISNLELSEWIRNNIEFDQLILEHYDASKGPKSGWVHVSYREGRNRQEVFTKLEGIAKYQVGLPPAVSP